MEKVTAVIRKVGNKYCVFSKDGKNLGCSSSRDGAEKRLKQVEFFKHKGKSAMADKYDDVFDNLTVGDLTPEAVDKPSNKPSANLPRPVNIEVTPSVEETLVPNGTIAGRESLNLLDRREHFPVITETQAKSAFSRVMQLTQTPDWYGGSLDDLRTEVCQGIMAAHPDLNVKIEVPVVALSDGETPHTDTTVKDPNNFLSKDKVPQVERPKLSKSEYVHHLSAACEDDETRKAVAGDIVENLKKQEEALKKAMKLAQRLLKEGVSGDEFAGLISFLQEDVLRELLHNGVTADVDFDRRAELIAKLTAQDKDKKKKKKESQPRPY